MIGGSGLSPGLSLSRVVVCLYVLYLITYRNGRVGSFVTIFQRVMECLLLLYEC